MRTVWDISNNKSKEELLYGKHPTQKPIKILERLLKLSSKEGDIMLTPFAGAGSECVAAKINLRNYIGFEIKKEYYDVALKRLENTIPVTHQFTLFDNIRVLEEKNVSTSNKMER